MTWTAADFAPGQTGEQFQELSDRLTLHGVPISDDLTTLRSRVQTWQLREGYKGTKFGQAADGFVGPKQIQQLWLPPKTISRISRRDWKLTLPSGQEISPEDFELFEEKPWFWETETGEQVFRAPTSGGQTTSSATKYLRSETRQMKGLSRAGWDPNIEPHVFNGSLCFTALPHVKEHAVGFQIHDGKDDVLQGRLEGRKLFLGSPYADKIVLSDDYQLGTWFDIEIVPSKSGILVVYNGKNFALPGITGTGWYYKYGCYIQAYAGQKFKVNGKEQIVPKDSWAEVRYRDAEVTAA